MLLNLETEKVEIIPLSQPNSASALALAMDHINTFKMKKIHHRSNLLVSQEVAPCRITSLKMTFTSFLPNCLENEVTGKNNDPLITYTKEH